MANDIETLRKYNIKAIINCAGEYCQNPFQKEMKYKSLYIKDSKVENIECLFYPCIDFIDDNVKKGGVLVHCVSGVSRSSTIVIAYLMWKMKINYSKAFDLVKDKRDII